MTQPASPHDPRRDRSGSSLPWVLAGAVLASLCCAAPLATVLIGIGGAASIIGLVRFKWEFLAVGLVVTLVGIGVTLRRRKASCSVKSYRRNRILLPAAGVLTVLVLVFGSQYLLLNDHLIRLASSRLNAQTQHQPAPVAAPAARQLDVAITSGVDCAACLMAIQQQLTDTVGVTGAAFVQNPAAPFVLHIAYDPARISQSALLTRIASAPGSVGGHYGTKVLSNPSTTSSGSSGATRGRGAADVCC